MSKLYTEKEVAELLKISVHTVRDWRCRPGTAPLKYVKIGRLVRYEERELMKYLEKRRSA
jgi:excisionase family DNA binding protein